MSYEEYKKLNGNLELVRHNLNVCEAIEEIEYCVKYSLDRKGFNGLKKHYPHLYNFALYSINKPEIFNKFSDYCQKSIKNIYIDQYPEHIPSRKSSMNVKANDLKKTYSAIIFMTLEGSRPPDGHILAEFLENIFKSNSQKRRFQLEHNVGIELFRELEYRHFETSDSFTHFLNTIRSIRIMEDSKERPYKLPTLYKWLKKIFINSKYGECKQKTVKQTIGDKLFDELEFWFKYTSPEENLIRFLNEVKIEVGEKNKRFLRKDPRYSRLENIIKRNSPLLDIVKKMEPELVDTTLKLWLDLKKS